MLVYIIISLTSTLYCYHAKSSSKKECRVSRSAHSTLIGLYSLTDTGSDIRSIRGLCKNITGPNECMSLSARAPCRSRTYTTVLSRKAPLKRNGTFRNRAQSGFSGATRGVGGLRISSFFPLPSP